MIAQNAYNPNGPTDHNAHTLKPNEITPRPDKEDPLSSIKTKPDRAYGNPQLLPSEEEAITDLYMSDGDDYTIDDSAFADAQMGTGENSTAASVAGSGGASGTNSNVNTGVFGGSARAAKPGDSLW